MEKYKTIKWNNNVIQRQLSCVSSHYNMDEITSIRDRYTMWFAPTDPYNQ